MNETDLVQGLRERNPAAVQYLSDCYLPSVWRFVYVRVGGDRHLAEDIMSETVLALIRAATTSEVVIGNVESWLRTVAGNKVVDHFRAAARVQHLIERSLPCVPIADHNDPSGRQEREEQRAEVRRVMEALPPRQRLVLEWKYLDQLSVREIGRRLELSEKATESILFRARREFRARIDRRATEKPEEPTEDGSLGDHPCRSVQEPCTDRSLSGSTSSQEARIPVNIQDGTATS